MNLSRDLLAMMQDFGVSASDGTRTAKGLLDSADEMLRAGAGPVALIGKSITFTLRTGDLDTTTGSRLTIAGTAYIVREQLQLDDGMLTRILCARG